MLNSSFVFLANLIKFFSTDLYIGPCKHTYSARRQITLCVCVCVFFLVFLFFLRNFVSLLVDWFGFSYHCCVSMSNSTCLLSSSFNMCLCHCWCRLLWKEKTLFISFVLVWHRFSLVALFSLLNERDEDININKQRNPIELAPQHADHCLRASALALLFVSEPILDRFHAEWSMKNDASVRCGKRDGQWDDFTACLCFI